uniref:Uncharacterized protein n=1 Tax=Romanomermis culicivorax TaxID=13658 RepID=A0A915LCH9_ROMCU
MQIKELDDQGRRHLHRSGAPEKDKYDNSNNHLEQRAKGPGAPHADRKLRKTLLGILQYFVVVSPRGPHGPIILDNLSCDILNFSRDIFVSSSFRSSSSFDSKICLNRQPTTFFVDVKLPILQFLIVFPSSSLFLRKLSFFFFNAKFKGFEVVVGGENSIPKLE